MGFKMNFIGEIIRVTDNGFRQIKRFYQALDYKVCPVREECYKSK
jgi:hypothetical protein